MHILISVAMGLAALGVAFLVFVNIHYPADAEARRIIDDQGSVNGHICLNKDMSLSPAEWAYTIAHCMLHNVFGHFDGEKMPGYEKKTLTILKKLHRQMSSLPS